MEIRARYVRHRTLPRIRYSRHFKAWLQAQATRTGLTTNQIFGYLTSGYTAQQVESLVPDAEPEEQE